MKKLFFAAFALIIGISSCNIDDGQRVRGNGQVHSKTFDLSGFDRLDINLPAAVIVKQDSSFGIKIETDDNLLSHLMVNTENHTLKIEEKVNFNLRASRGIKIYISMPVVKQITLSSAASLKTENKIEQNEPVGLDINEASSATIALKTPEVNIKVSEASTLVVSGETRDVKGQVNEASTLRAYDLKAENTNIEANEASTANVFASVQLTAQANEASSISYMGNPQVNSNSSSAGSVKKAD
ncbi:head GIN domain-containing protein [Niabella soli]|uniref:Putative auto-transporter adhesin head GIN domain-containing protein n=1 Tax=Niabella soli DSM 19437 TaxID=929713 RepID=W0F790_9BACT|nr:head GIN domain-containing protein [Niabella soli]AHF17663.1 hypothetical protein NIASO_11865 [Niabella soli DSM 19437]